jgi:hypothetical protein
VSFPRPALISISARRRLRQAVCQPVSRGLRAKADMLTSQDLQG